MEVYVCVGSSCHLKGSYNIIELIKQNIEKYNLSDKIELKATFCLGHCTEGVSIKIDDEIVCGVSEKNFDQLFKTYILDKVK